jgi:hypothetical protein
MSSEGDPTLLASEDALQEALLEVIQETVVLCRARFDGQLPLVAETGGFWEPAGTGSHRWVGFDRQRVAWHQVRAAIGDEIAETPTWTRAEGLVKSFLTGRVLLPVFDSNIREADFMWRAIDRCLGDQSVLRLQRRTALLRITDFLEAAKRSSDRAVCLLIVDGFSASHEFAVEPGIRVRKIRRKDLELFGAQRVPIQLPDQVFVPRADCWLWEIQYPNPRGTADGWTAVSRATEPIRVVHAAFKGGRVVTGPGLIMIDSPFPFGRGMLPRSDPMSMLSRTNQTFGRGEVRRFVVFWRTFRPLMQLDRHYLQLPVRRLHSGTNRDHQEDALVDYVIGLEALLGLDDERTEMAYRFRTRGAVLMAGSRGSRREHFRRLNRLYDLRSRIVHGLPPQNASDLSEGLEYAEHALRRVWHWFFANWRNEDSNVAGVKRIDELLIGA